MKKIIFITVATLLATNVFAKGNDPTVFGYLTFGKTTTEEFKSQLPQHCKITKLSSRDERYKQFRLENNCFDLLGSPRVWIQFKNDRLAKIVWKFKSDDAYKDYMDILTVKYGQPEVSYRPKGETFSGGVNNKWWSGDTIIFLSATSGTLGFDIDYEFLGDAGKYNPNYRNERKHTQGMM